MQRYLHISARLATTMVNGNPQTYVVRPGTTFTAGRNAEKRKARHREKLIRQADVNIYLSSPLMQAVNGREPKQIKSNLTAEMLANRRLRQRQGESDPRVLLHSLAA